MDFPRLSKPELFERLAKGVQCVVTVITPNRRLAQELAREFDASRIAQGLESWEAADILPFGSFVERLWESAVYSEAGASVPVLLSASQEQALWEDIIASSAWSAQLLSPARTSAQCRDAWRLAHAWRIDGALGKFPGNDDAQAFAEWAGAYTKRTARDVDAARLPDIAAKLLGVPSIAPPRVLIAYAFDIVPAQTADFLRSAQAAGIDVMRCGSQRRVTTPQRVTRSSAREELETAAQWARARLEEAHERGAHFARIAVVVPDLERRREEVKRVFSRVMEPGWNLPGATVRPLPFNISIGVPLGSYPLAHAALGLVALAAGEIDFALASRLIRSPFIGGADSEVALRAQLDANLRDKLPARVSLARIVGAIDGCPLLRERFEALFNYAGAHLSGMQSPHEWARHFSQLLEAAGFPGERALDSAEYQTRVKWYEVLAEFALLERVVPRLNCAQALVRLRRLAVDTLFQPESRMAPVQILGILESAGLEFDHLWVSGLTDDAWPLAARPNPFIPVALQKKAGIPEAAADTALALDRRITADWMSAASEVVVSHALREKDRDLLPSALIASVVERDVELPQYPDYRDLLHHARSIEKIADGVAPAYAAKEVRGGVRVLADQAACPFRAFARYRLNAEGLATPADGLDARDRGNLLHALMAHLWGTLGSKSKLDAMPATELAAAIDEAARAAVAKVREQRAGVLEGRLAELECARLGRLAHEWLDVERLRGDFEVVAREEKRMLTAAGLAFNGRIDRMDWLAGPNGGGHVLIDYKTGRATPKDWLDERPDDPQMPLYAIAAKEDVVALAFARIKTGDMRFTGLALEGKTLPKVKAVDGWRGLLEVWRRQLDALGREFADGVAVVDPKRGLKTCRHCDLQPLCRVHERLAALEDEDEGDDE
ncbi:MAG TPA: PD-(D/E)XK nuclease family protein [Burkholderiales bacterium]|nr:PD-(D/E)XK nuclease family protein [Burkholderiales bacterium]